MSGQAFSKPAEIYLAASKRYTEHERTADLHGFDIADATHNGEHESTRQDLIWVGIPGEGGRWLKAEEALELAAAIEHMANAQTERVFKAAHRKFLINHPGAGDGGAA